MTGAALEGWDVVERAAQLARDGVAFALATVVWRQGPSSGQQGARAIITADGEIHGFIGGACAEPVVVREAQRVIAEGVPQLLLLGTAAQFAGAVPDGMRTIPIACQSEGALEVYVEPVVPAPLLVVVGRSPMAHTLVELATALGWHATVLDVAEFTAAPPDPRAAVVVATQGQGDEEAVEHAVRAEPAFLGVVASHRRGESVVGYLQDRGVPGEALARVRVPVGLDLGHTTHREIAVSVLAELVQVRAAGELGPSGGPAPEPAATTRDPVCGMTVTPGPSAHPFAYEGTTYHFCCAGCRAAFEKDPAAYLSEASC